MDKRKLGITLTKGSRNHKRTSLESMSIRGLGRVVQQLVEAHGVGAELAEVVLVIAEAHGHGAHDLLGELHDAAQVVHAGLPERRAERLGPHVGPVGELVRLDLGVVQRQVPRHVVSLLEVGTRVVLDLAVHDFVAAVVGILCFVRAMIVEMSRYMR